MKTQVQHEFRSALIVTVIIAAAVIAGRAGDVESVFGQAQSEAALMGVMYDFKQFPDHKATNVGVDQGYCNVITEFINKGWDESVLNRYYRVSRPLFTTQVFVPNMNADNAPKAFGAEKLVKPTAWLIEYKGQVSAPAAGSYRFWGCADDVMAVAIDGKTELVAHHWLTNLSAVKWHQPPPNIGAQAADDYLVPGDWFAMREGQIIDLDIIISERPGGLFNAFVLIEKQGEKYAKDAGGHPILPIFQVAPSDTPQLHQLDAEPEFALGFPPWKSYQ